MMGKKNTEGVPLTCYHKDCGYGWLYDGANTFYATCPRCMRKVNIKKGYGGAMSP